MTTGQSVLVGPTGWEVFQEWFIISSGEGPTILLLTSGLRPRRQVQPCRCQGRTWVAGDLRVNENWIICTSRTCLLRKQQLATIYYQQEAVPREEYKICSAQPHRTQSVSQWPIYYFYPVQWHGRMHQGAASLAMNNLSQAATCEIIQLTRIYNTS